MTISAEELERRRRSMALRGISDSRVLEAMASVPRHLFVPPELADQAYDDHPLPIGFGQTISQPYIVALMTQMLRLQGPEKVLEIGTGSGYQTAILSLLAREVYSIELTAPLADEAAERLRTLGYAHVHVRAGDGWLGWPEQAPFDAIMVTCAADSVPPPLEEQLAEGGRMMIPVGPPYDTQTLVFVRKEGGRISRENVTGVVFVPLRRLHELA
jgi:protein-L-isoaspartate(D-aspartate) O-methyltransferase